MIREYPPPHLLAHAIYRVSNTRVSLKSKFCCSHYIMFYEKNQRHFTFQTPSGKKTNYINETVNIFSSGIYFLIWSSFQCRFLRMRIYFRLFWISFRWMSYVLKIHRTMYWLQFSAQLEYYRWIKRASGGARQTVWSPNTAQKAYKVCSPILLKIHYVYKKFTKAFHHKN